MWHQIIHLVFWMRCRICTLPAFWPKYFSIIIYFTYCLFTYCTAYLFHVVNIHVILLWLHQTTHIHNHLFPRNMGMYNDSAEMYCDISHSLYIVLVWLHSLATFYYSTHPLHEEQISIPSSFSYLSEPWGHWHFVTSSTNMMVYSDIIVIILKTKRMSIFSLIPE